MEILFINSSPNKNGETARLAKELMKGKAYETVNLINYKIYAYGQDFPDDEFDKIIEKMRSADIVVMGSPLYWHNICGLMRNLLDRSYGYLKEGEFGGKSLYFIMQGAAPTPEQLTACEFTMARYARLYGFSYMGMITNSAEAKREII